MREIKFRGWHKDAEDMVYFGLGEDNIQCEGEDGEKFKFMIKDGHPVMQFTGLKDKNGEEIYEGDIVSNGIVAHEVKHGEYLEDVNCKEYTNFGYGFYVGEDAEFSDFDQLKNSRLWEVIGNVYQNPELLNA